MRGFIFQIQLAFKNMFPSPIRGAEIRALRGLEIIIAGEGLKFENQFQGIKAKFGTAGLDGNRQPYGHACTPAIERGEERSSRSPPSSTPQPAEQIETQKSRPGLWDW